MIGSLAAVSLAPASPAAADGFWGRRDTVPRGGGVIGYAILGQRTSQPFGQPPVILLPKLGGWIDDWRHAAPLLAKGRQVIAIDPPGHGSSRMNGAAPYIQTVAESATMIRAALDKIGIDRFALVGNSLGGCIATAMAALFPADVTHLALVSVALAARKSREEIAAADAAVAPGLYQPDWTPIPRTFERMTGTFGLTREIHEEMNRSRAVAGRWVRASERGVMRAGMEDFLPRITAQTLLVYGSTGPYPRYRATAERLLRKVDVAVIEGTGSFVHQERPAEVGAVLDRFLGA
jgi:pimeloyl-ACP methyl ester carboxylesterase